MSDDPVISTKDRPGSYDAIETAKPGEPLFPVQGGDPIGPKTVQFWVDEQRKLALACTDEKRARAMLQKASQAEEVAWAMLAYQRGEEAVEERRLSYSDNHDETDEKRTTCEILIHGAGRLHNALAIVAEVADSLAKNRLAPFEEVALREAVEQIKEAAIKIEPRRGKERT